MDQQWSGDRAAATARVYAFVEPARADAVVRAVRARLVSLQSTGILRSARLHCAAVRAEDWSESWKRFFRPLKVAEGLYVVPPWESAFRPPGEAASLSIDPGMAFGTGQHATTKLALRLSLPHLNGATMLDVGCGSGILALAGALKGAKVYACDRDPIAVSATRLNFKRNSLNVMAVRRASGVPASFPIASLIVANITGDVLAALAGRFASHLKTGGVVVTSGITRRTSEIFCAAFAAAGLRLVRRRSAGEWLAYVHLRA